MTAVVECTKCHTPLPDNSKFCFACGADQTGGGTVTSGEVEGLQGRLQKVVQGKYELVRMVGKGGMGAVFLAQDLTLEREVAIKVLPPDISQDPQVIKRFQQEARTAAKLDHTNIIPIYRVESEGGLNYFVMKFVSGTSLEDLLEQQKTPLSPDYIQRVLWEAARALGHAHHRGIVHRDVKPANIMFDHDGRVMLTDFGISKALQSAGGLTGTGMIVGTPHYMAPEQAKGQPVDGRADQYSLGIVGYRLLSGTLPFSGDSVHTILYKHIFEPAPSVAALRPGIPRNLTDAIQRALSKEPADRFPTMEAFADAVRGSAAAGTADATTPLPAPAAIPATVQTPRRSRVPRTALAVAALVLVSLSAWLGLRGRRAAVPPVPADTTAIAHSAETTTATPQSTATVLSKDLPETTVTSLPQVMSTPAPPLQTTPTRAGRPAPPAAAVGGEGYLEIDSDPTAELFVDGVDMGPTPLFHHRVPSGQHALRLEASGYQTQRVSVRVEPGRTLTKTYKLNPE